MGHLPTQRQRGVPQQPFPWNLFHGNPWQGLHHLWNTVSFTLRAAAGGVQGSFSSHRDYCENPDEDGPYTKLLTSPAVLSVEATMDERYGFKAHRARMAPSRYLENLAILAELEALWGRGGSPCFPPEHAPGSPLHWLDVGCKNFSYVDAIMAFAYGETGAFPHLVGYEVDGYRRYRDGYTRADYAKAHLAHYGGQVEVHWADVLKETASYDVVSCFLPFLFPEPCLAWGLPLEYCAPESLFRHLLSRLKVHGRLIVVNQGEAEAVAQGELLKRLMGEGEMGQNDAMTLTPLGVLEDPMAFRQYPRYGWCVTRQEKQPQCIELDILKDCTVG